MIYKIVNIGVSKSNFLYIEARSAVEAQDIFCSKVGRAVFPHKLYEVIEVEDNEENRGKLK